MTIETKYNINDTVYFMKNNKVSSGIVIGVLSSNGSYDRYTEYRNTISYNLKCDGYDSMNISENLLFLSKEDVLKSL